MRKTPPFMRSFHFVFIIALIISVLIRCGFAAGSARCRPNFGGFNRNLCKPMQKKHGTPPLLSAFCFITVLGGAPGRTRTVRPEKTSVLGLNNVDFGDTINIGYNVTLQSSPFKKFFGRAMFSCRKHSAAEGAAVTTKEFAKLCGVEKRTLFFYDEIDLLKPARILPNGYREYDFSQLPRMESIRLLQSAGLNLREIKSMLLCESGHNIDIVNDCRQRVMQQMADMQAGLCYIERRVALRKSYLEHAPGEIYTENAPALPISAINADNVGSNHSLGISYFSLGHYLGVEEDAEALHPRRFFKHCRSETANAFLPAGQYACMFLHEADNEQIFYISPWVKRFVELAEAKGLSVERTVYVEDLPAWLIDEPRSMILRFAARITS